MVKVLEGVAAVQGLKMVGVVGIEIGLHLLSEVGGAEVDVVLGQVVARSDGVYVGVGALKDTGHFQG